MASPTYESRICEHLKYVREERDAWKTFAKNLRGTLECAGAYLGLREEAFTAAMDTGTAYSASAAILQAIKTIDALTAKYEGTQPTAADVGPNPTGLEDLSFRLPE